MPRIVIVGAGPAGINAAHVLATKLKPTDNTEVVVLEKSRFYYHAVGAPRAYTEETFTPKMFIPYDKAIPANTASYVRLIRAVATRVSATEVAFQRVGDDDKSVAETETLTFDYLIIATGSTYTVPIKQDPNDYSRAHTEHKLQEVRDQIAKANKILVVGGGAVGCEVAGDIAFHFPNKQVTILEGRSRLVAVDNVKDSFRTKLTDALKTLKVKVVLGERTSERLTGNSFEKRTFTTDKGTVIESDIQLLCAGFSPSGELVHAMDASVVDPNGAIRVNDKLQLSHARYAHIFALGDATNHPTPKLAYYASEQAKHVAGELVAVVRNKQSVVMKPFPRVGLQPLILPLGPNGGVTQLPLFGGWVLGDRTTRALKARDMLASRLWAEFGVTVPQ